MQELWVHVCKRKLRPHRQLLGYHVKIDMFYLDLPSLLYLHESIILNSLQKYFLVSMKYYQSSKRQEFCLYSRDDYRTYLSLSYSITIMSNFEKQVFRFLNLSPLPLALTLLLFWAFFLLLSAAYIFWINFNMNSFLLILLPLFWVLSCLK